ncbi:F0F1 ATP synthase subunit A [Spiractinospora alimapuensis]|nr:F0F1 ATP synthase subunit A [Spiractinospora alimapuensis]
MFSPEPWIPLNIPWSNGIDLYTPLLIVAVLVTIGVWAWFSRNARLVPSRRQSLAEILVQFIRDNVARPTMGKKGDFLIPFLVSLFTFILFMNLTGIIPGMFPVNSNIAFPAVLALVIFIMRFYLAVKYQGGWQYIKGQIFPPGVPAPLYVLVTPIKFVSSFLVYPFTHTLRLFATMFAGSLVLAVFAYGGAYMMNWAAGPALGALSTAFAGIALAAYVGFVLFEVLIMLIQAFVFTLLSSLYFGQALEEAH